MQSRTILHLDEEREPWLIVCFVVRGGFTRVEVTESQFCRRNVRRSRRVFRSGGRMAVSVPKSPTGEDGRKTGEEVEGEGKGRGAPR
jgi:hypothetical protein